MTWFDILAKVDAPGGVIKEQITNTAVTNIFNFVLAIAGAIAVAFIVWGGVQYILSHGEPGHITKAKNTLLYAVIGLLVVMFSLVIVNFVIGKF